jgi:hypothetical protein
MVHRLNLTEDILLIRKEMHVRLQVTIYYLAVYMRSAICFNTSWPLGNEPEYAVTRSFVNRIF